MVRPGIEWRRWKMLGLLKFQPEQAGIGRGDGLLSTAVGSPHDAFYCVANVGDQIWIENQLGFDGPGKSACRNFNRQRGVAKEDGTGLSEALLAVSVDMEFLLDGVAVVCRGTVEGGEPLLGILHGNCSAER